jgi:hypothetical protein
MHCACLQAPGQGFVLLFRPFFRSLELLRRMQDVRTSFQASMARSSALMA